MNMKKALPFLLLPVFALLAQADTPPAVNILSLKAGTTTGIIAARSGSLFAIPGNAVGDLVSWTGTTWATGQVVPVTSVGATAPVQSSGGQTPVISIPQASSLDDGYLSSTDWNTFDSKVTSVSGAAPISSTGGTTPTLSIAMATSTANGYMASSTFALFQSGSLSAQIFFVENRTFVLELSASEARTLTSVVLQLESGTCTVDIKINGTTVTGMGSLSANTNLQSFFATALNSVSANDKITLVVTSASGASNLQATLKYLRGP